jgi:hypothetical protein
VLALRCRCYGNACQLEKVLAGLHESLKRGKPPASSGDPPGARACELPAGLLSSSHDLLGDRGGPPFHVAERHISSCPTRHSPGAPLQASLLQTKAASKAWARSTDASLSNPMGRHSRLYAASSRGELLQFHSGGVDQNCLGPRHQLI